MDMKERTKRKLYLFGIVILGAIILASLYFTLVYKDNSIDCSKPVDIIFLKPSEVSQASEVADNINGVVIIPYETGNRIVARTEILNCPNFNYSYYLNLGRLD